MDLQKFMQTYIPNWDYREDVKKYLSLKECLADKNQYNRLEAADLFREFLIVKDKLFDEGNGSFFNKKRLSWISHEIEIMQIKVF